MSCLRGHEDFHHMRIHWLDFRWSLHTSTGQESWNLLFAGLCWPQTQGSVLHRSSCSLILDCQSSVNGYGQCSYLRLVNKSGQVYCSFVMGKARVTPLKNFTVSRLELTAALVSTKASSVLQEELDYKKGYGSVLNCGVDCDIY